MSKSKAVRQVDPEEVKKVNEAAPDWTGTCRVCGAHLTGTLEELRKHKHGE